MTNHLTRSARAAIAAALLAAGTCAVTVAGPITPSVGAASSVIDTSDDTPWTLPSTPPRCTRAEADSGDVAGCIIAFYADPDDIGWGTPPSPGSGDGWTWNGYWYNGSPALSAWESEHIAANTDAIGRLWAGALETHAGAQKLFEGFLNEVSANGYQVRSGGGYAFRCTAGNGGWICPSGDIDDLSNHAWGLAIDINAGTNPIRSYTGINGKTACLTPIETDMPRWVVQTAEKWGLYWGGYGWNSGCQSTSTQRSKVSRDPPHFEFRGTPEQARAIYEFNIGNDPRRRCFDTFGDDGEPTERCNLTGTPEAGWRLPVDTEAPEGAVAAMVNLTAALPAAAGHLSLETCGAIDGHDTSAVNFAVGETAAAMAVVPIDADGRFCVFRSTDVHSIVDVVGFLTESGERLWFDPSVPRRLIDTRRDGDRTPVADQTSRDIPTTDDAPRVANLTVVDSRGAGHAQAASCTEIAAADHAGGEGDFSNINYVDGTTRANMVLLDNGDAGACVWVYRETHVVVDELGRLLPDAGLGWQIGAPRRVLDTRRCSDNWCDGQPAGGQAFAVDIDVAAPAVAVTLTIDRASAPGHAWIGGCDELVDGLPPTSNVNYVPGKATANMAIVAPDAGEVCVYLHAAADVIIDVQAELVDDRTVGLQPVSPHRAHDSRQR